MEWHQLCECMSVCVLVHANVCHISKTKLKENKKGKCFHDLRKEEYFIQWLKPEYAKPKAKVNS